MVCTPTPGKDPRRSRSPTPCGTPDGGGMVEARRGSEPWPERRCAHPLLTQTVLCAIAIAAFLLHHRRRGIPGRRACISGSLPAGSPRNPADPRPKVLAEKGSKESENEERRTPTPGKHPPALRPNPRPIPSSPARSRSDGPGKTWKSSNPNRGGSRGETSPKISP